MKKEYLEKVIKIYGDEITSISFNNGKIKYNVGIFYEDFNVNEPTDAVFQIYCVEEGDLEFDVDDIEEDEPDYNSYNMIQFGDISLVSVKSILENDNIVLYREVQF